MTYADVLRYCLALPDTQKRYSSGSDKSFSLNVGEMPFAYFETGAPIQWQFVIRVTDALFEQLPRPPQVRKTERGEGRWLIIARVENFDEKQLKEMILWSYQQTLSAA